ncbi:MAG: carboxyl transferase [Oscillospiraceae bacterium]|nr:carboxyl transferase [Oscillospiraceae bacterium]
MEKNAASPARARLALLFDGGEYREFGTYTAENGNPAGVVTGYGFVNGNPVYAFAQDQSVENGAVGAAQAEKISKVYTLAAKTGAPVVGIYDSNGAFMDGTAASLNAYSLIMKRVSQISGVVPQIALVAGVCAGSAAMAAAAADFVVMTKDAELFLTPSFEKGAGSAEAAAKNGIAAAIAEDDAAAAEEVRKLINLLPVNNMAMTPCMEYEAPSVAAGNDLASYVDSIADGGSVVELYKDFGGAAYTTLATVNGSTVAICATNKTEDRLTEADCSKLSRFVRTADAFSIPVITLVDTLGFAGNADTELAGSVKSLTRLAGSYAEATTAKISVVTGNAVGAVFVALAGKGSNADFAYALESACIAPLMPEAAAEFLWHDKLKGCNDLAAKRKELAKEYSTTLASAEKAANLGVVDDIVTPADLRAVIASALSMLEGKRVTNLPKKHNNFPY